mgnify:CR=1 FL=1
MKYTILCSDLDGTLLTTKSDVSKITISEIKRIKNKTQIILVSARMPKAMRYVQKDLGILHEPIICYNGALILEDNKEISSTIITISQLELIYTLAKKHQIKLGLYYKDEWYVEKDSERVQKEKKHTKVDPVFKNIDTVLKEWKKKNAGAHKVMLMGTKESADIAFSQLQQTLSKELNIYRSNDTLIELAPKSVSKLSAIKELLKKNDTLKNVISFGDNYNDINMLQHTGCGVAVGNAREEVKRIASVTTLKNTEDGVAHYIKQHL